MSQSEFPTEPIHPMEPVRAEKVPEGEEWIAQVKWDGVRVLTYANGENVRLFNRHKRPRAHHYPELLDVQAYCKAKSVILDGEVIALGPNGKPSFHEVMRRDGIRRLDRIDAVRRAVPVNYMIFDILYADGEWLTNRPLSERLHRLRTVVEPAPHVQLVDSQTDGAALFHVMQSHQMEGIVAKRLDSSYRIGQKVDTWRKVKFYRDVVAVVGGYTVNDSGVANALLLGLYDPAGALVYIGHVGTGHLTQSDWRTLTQQLQSLSVDDSPFVNRPPRGRPVYWTRPAVTVRVAFAEVTTGGTLRQPSVQSVVQVAPLVCTLDTF